MDSIRRVVKWSSIWSNRVRIVSSIFGGVCDAWHSRRVMMIFSSVGGICASVSKVNSHCVWSSFFSTKACKRRWRVLSAVHLERSSGRLCLRSVDWSMFKTYRLRLVQWRTVIGIAWKGLRPYDTNMLECQINFIDEGLKSRDVKWIEATGIKRLKSPHGPGGCQNGKKDMQVWCEKGCGLELQGSKYWRWRVKSGKYGPEVLGDGVIGGYCGVQNTNMTQGRK